MAIAAPYPDAPRRENDGLGPTRLLTAGRFLTTSRLGLRPKKDRPETQNSFEQTLAHCAQYAVTYLVADMPLATAVNFQAPV